MGKSGKDTYKIKNWSEYNKSLCTRGRLTLFITAGVIFEWGKIDPKKKVVGEKMYPDSICTATKPYFGKNYLHAKLKIRRQKCN
ncbi:hypothetical protein AGMMS49940_02460 [Spirochaetia bacterium]|nr:hypothetical protein AGMMS49940_02460 [Spirochaetia bacterium]